MTQLYLGWQLDPLLIGSLLTSALCYGLATTVLRPYISADATFSRKKASIFYGGLLLLYLAEGSPLHDLADDYLFSAHMVQHLLIAYIAAPLLIWGMPTWLLDALLANRYTRPISRLLMQPVAAALIFSILFSLWHFPVFYEGALRNADLHHLEHVVFLTISLIMWFPVMSPSKKLPAMPYLGQVAYLFVLPIIQMVTFALLTYASAPIYQAYINAPRIWGIAPLHDQVWAGVVMKLGSMLAFGIPLVAVFMKWYAEENPEEIQQRRAQRARRLQASKSS